MAEQTNPARGGPAKSGAETDTSRHVHEAAEDALGCAVCEAIDEGLILLAEDGTVLDANRAARALMARPNGLGQAVNEAFGSLTKDIDLATLPIGARGKTELHLGERWLSASRHELPGGETPGLSVLVIHDESARHKALSALERERRLFFDGPVIVFRWVATEGWPVEYVSPNVQQLFGYSAEDFMTGRVPYASTVHPDDLERVAAEVSAHSDSGVRSFDQDYRIVRPDGDVRWLSDFTVVNRNEQGEITHYSGYAFDVTERKLQEQAQQRLEEHVRHTQKLESLGVLAGGIAHDFNNLLVGIMGNACLAREDLPDDSPTQAFLEEIEQASLRAAELSNQMLAYSGKGRFRIELVDINELIHETVKLVRSSVSSKAQLNFDLADELPAIEGDGTQLRQLVMNLVTNASDALPGGRGTIDVITRLADLTGADFDGSDALVEGLVPGPYLVLEVVDNGIGMSDETRRKLFDPFFTTKFTGRGLGMAAALGIVRSHKGGIRVASALQQGTRFEVMIPVALGVDAPPTRRMPRSLGRPGNGAILVVDDEELVLQLARKVLERAGYEVTTTSGGKDAIDRLRQGGPLPSLVLLDLTMPEFDGSETFAALERLAPEVPVILSSGFSEQEAAARFVGRGLAGFIQKPYAPAALVAKVQQVLGLSAHSES